VISKAQLYFILALLFALIVVVFAIQNHEAINIKFLVWQFKETSKALVILVSTAIGALMVVFLGFWWQLKRFIHIRQLEGEIKELKNRLSEISSQVEIKEEKDGGKDA